MMRPARRPGRPGDHEPDGGPVAPGATQRRRFCSIVAGLLTGADSIADLGVLREGAVHKVFPGVKVGEGGGGLLLPPYYESLSER